MRLEGSGVGLEHRGGIDIAFGSLAYLGWESSTFCMVGEIFISTGSDSTGSNISTRPMRMASTRPRGMNTTRMLGDAQGY